MKGKSPKQSSLFSTIFRSILSVFKEEEKKRPKKAKKRPESSISKDRGVKTQNKVKKGPKSPYANVQMPAPWSKVEKYKRIKKGPFGY